MFSLVKTISLKVCERSLSLHAKCSLLVSVRGSKNVLAYAYSAEFLNTTATPDKVE